MPDKKLKISLESIAWKDNINHYLSIPSIPLEMAKGSLRLAIWSKQLEDTDTGNPALSFIREMQIAGHHAVMLTSIALYKPAAAAMRTALETALYYTYFRTHPTELATLTRNEGYYTDRKEIIDFHKTHTPSFVESEKEFGLISNLGKWYARISAIVHGQLPGKWTTHTALANLAHSDALISAAAKEWTAGEELIHQLFLCTVGRVFWGGFSSTSKQQLLAGLHGKTRTTLGLDKA
ncbi:hypothetical protein [Corallococcus sp. AB038B]|uniref:hypothetical protein n=1 Tax=Corallococcus sp. AB038B TaxID=2316718 RepID=UPI0011C38C3B|nr:hypothetical protein [Corallococcus sp. AB038B]